MDKLSQLGKNLKLTEDNVNTSLRREFKDEPIIQRTRDIFDYMIPFDMEFIIPENLGTAVLNLIFTLPPDSCCGGCYCAVCEIYTEGEGDFGTSYTTTYPYIQSSVTVLVMNSNNFLSGNEFILSLADRDYAFIDSNTIDVYYQGATEANPIKICYTYKIVGCNP